MVSVFWDAHGTIFVDYLEKGKIINSLSDEIKKKGRGEKGKLLHQYNARIHRSVIAVAKIKINKLLIFHAPYSPDSFSLEKIARW